jgi:hypothetical protein
MYRFKLRAVFCAFAACKFIFDAIEGGCVQGIYIYSKIKSGFEEWSPLWSCYVSL